MLNWPAMSDATATRRDDATGWLSVAEAALALGITPGAVRKRAERGQLANERGPGGRLRVRLLPVGNATARQDTTRPETRRDATEAAAAPTALVDALQAEVGYLRSELTRANERLDDERRQRDDERRRHDTIVAQLTGRPLELGQPAAGGVTNDKTIISDTPPDQRRTATTPAESDMPGPNETTVELRLPDPASATEGAPIVPSPRPWWRFWGGA